ncbi:hypothetical protein KP509_08G020400 [Ceratopteris richardii]|nr:hypothetical protein KP509_08G020400 [Ceratopteris richardii]
MEHKGIKPDNVTIVNILKACHGCASLNGGKLLHTWIMENDFDVDEFVWSSLIDMYAKHDHIKDAQKLFDSFSTHDEVTWSTMIAAFVVHNLWEEAFLLFKKMQCLCIKPGRVTFLNVLRAISETFFFEDGRLVHAYVVERAYDYDRFVLSSLIDMYAKCSSLMDAKVTFENSQKDDPASWGAIINGYFQQGLVKDGFHLFDIMKMKGPIPHIGVWNVVLAGCVLNEMECWPFTLFKQMEDEGILPDSTTFTHLVKACWCSMNLEHGRVLNSLIVEDGFDRHKFVGNSLIDMYTKFGKLEDAHYVFLHLDKTDAVSWNTLIEGYAQHQRGEEAILQYRLMCLNGFKPDKVTILSVLKASAIILAVEEGMLIHATAITINCESDGSVGSSLIDMYARCGLLNEASKVFERFKEVKAAWNSMISGLACNGTYSLGAYPLMRSYGIEPDRLTYLCLLSACSHLGLVDEGRNHFVTMTEHWKMKPTVEHYGCMVDLWGRVGSLKEAHQVLMSSPWKKSSVVSWFALMHHSQVHGRFDLAKLCLDQIVWILGCKNESGYRLMASFFCDTRLHDHFDGVRSCNLDAKWRIPGHALIEAQGRIHTFVVGDKTHEESQAVYLKLKILSSSLRYQGYVPHTSMLMQRLPHISEQGSFSDAADYALPQEFNFTVREHWSSTLFNLSVVS